MYRLIDNTPLTDKLDFRKLRQQAREINNPRLMKTKKLQLTDELRFIVKSSEEERK